MKLRARTDCGTEGGTTSGPFIAPVARVRDAFVSRVVHPVMALLGRALPELAENPFATHVPVLVGLAGMFEIRRVLELGCGQHSTSTFLNRAAFPRLERLDSLENDPAWRDRIGEIVAPDGRATLRLVEGPMRAAVDGLDLRSYDLIFVDDSTRYEDRAATIAAVVRKGVGSGLLVVHDFEVKLYRQATRGMRHRFRFTALNPNTGLACNDRAIDYRRLRRLNAVIRQNGRHVPHADARRWREVLAASPCLSASVR